MAQDAATPYPNMAPIDQYLMADRDAEIALARSAVPESIARDAEYSSCASWFETAVKGKNGFVCIVDGVDFRARSDFWNPKVRVPMCVNSAAAAFLPCALHKETEWGLAGRTPAQMNESITAALGKKELPPMNPERCVTCCRSKATAATRRPTGLRTFMFFYSDTDPAIWGANLPGSPVRWYERPRGAPDAVRDSCATLVGRNGRR